MLVNFLQSFANVHTVKHYSLADFQCNNKLTIDKIADKRAVASDAVSNVRNSETAAIISMNTITASCRCTHRAGHNQT